MSGIAAISGVVRKDGVAVEGAKVYILHDGEVVSSGESDESGEYSCGGLSLDNKYHAVVEYEEIDGDDIIHYSAKSMPGIEPISGTVYLYNEGEGGEDWQYTDYDAASSFTLEQDHMLLEIETWTNDGGAELFFAQHPGYYETSIDLTDINFVKLEYTGGYTGYGSLGSKLCVQQVSAPQSEICTVFPFVYQQKSVAVIDVSELSGMYYVKIRMDLGGYNDEYLKVYQVWLE